MLLSKSLDLWLLAIMNIVILTRIAWTPVQGSTVNLLKLTQLKPRLGQFVLSLYAAWLTWPAGFMEKISHCGFLAPGLQIAIFSDFWWFPWRRAEKKMTGERSQLSQCEPGSHLCWPCVTGLPHQCRSHFPLQHGRDWDGVENDRDSKEKHYLIVFGNKLRLCIVEPK